LVLQIPTISVDLLNQTRTLETEIERILAILDAELAKAHAPVG